MSKIMTVFSADLNDITKLDQQSTVDFFRRLLWAEADRVGVSRQLILVPSCINVGDGGIDAYISDAKPTLDDIIPSGYSGVQIKAGDLQPEKCRKELYVKGTCNLKPEVKRVLDSGGTYVLVLFHEMTGTMRNNRMQAIKDEFAKNGYSDAKVRVYTASQLQGFTERFPSLVISLKGLQAGCLHYQGWSKSELGNYSPVNFQADKPRKDAIESIQNKLRSSNESCPIFRIDGLPGIGKTRLVLESLAPPDIQNKVIYIKADAFCGSQLLYGLLNDQNYHATVVVDECDLKTHQDLCKQFMNQSGRLALFTMSYDIGTVFPPTVRIQLNRLNDNDIKAVIKDYAPKLPEEVVSRITKFADGYPRIAVLLAGSYDLNSDSANFANISDKDMFDRLIGGNDTHSEHFRKTRQVLRGLSLFTKVGYIKPVDVESNWLADFVGVKDEFLEIVQEQRERGIIQGQSYIYVTPFMLRIQLLREWWNLKNFSLDDFNKFVEVIPEEFRRDLLERFIEQLPFISETRQGTGFLKEVLDRKGPFSDIRMLNTGLGSRMFGKLAEADPEAALECLKNTIGTQTREELLSFDEGRREIVWALERIAVWKNLFADAARLLLALGEAENETWSNNASGVFQELFSPGPGRVATTEASPQERLHVIEEALNSDSYERRKLGLGACNAALQADSFCRTVGSEYQGLRRLPDLWRPKTWDEITSAYRGVWNLLRTKLDSLPADERLEAIDILLKRSIETRAVNGLADDVITTLEELATKDYVDSRNVLEQVIFQCRNNADCMSDSELKRWQKLETRLTGSDYPALMKRYVGMSILDDELDEHEGKSTKVREQITALADESLSDPKLLSNELSWLVTQEAPRGYDFGYQLGTRDIGFTLLPELLTAQRNASEKGVPYFLGGYFKAIFEADPNRWDELLNEVSEDKNLQVQLPELVWRSSISKSAGLLILKLAQCGAISARHLRVFGYGRVIEKLPKTVFDQWIEYLLRSGDAEACPIALDLYSHYYLRNQDEQQLPLKLTRRLLLHKVLFENPENVKLDNMTEYHWAEIGKAFAKAYPQEGPAIAKRMIQSVGNSKSVVGGYNPRSYEVLDIIAEQDTIEVWNMVAQLLERKDFRAVFEIKNWVRGQDTNRRKFAFIDVVPREELWKWIEEDAQKRASLVAYLVPKHLSQESLAYELLVRYGNQERVRHELMASFQSGAWWGPESQNLENTRQWLLNLKGTSPHQNVALWIEEYLEVVNESIKRARLREEREGF